jgi:hypothetical protein
LPSEHPENKTLLFWEFVLAITLMVVAVVGLIGFGGYHAIAFAKRVFASSSASAVRPPLQDGELIPAREVRTVFPGVDVPVGDPVSLQVHLPYEGADPGSAHYTVVRPTDRP